MSIRSRSVSNLPQSAHLTTVTLVALVALLLTGCVEAGLPSSEEVSSLFAHGDICGLPATTSTNFLLLLIAGLVTGLSHCVGMCGPLVTAFVIRRRQTGGDTSSAVVLYQMGRLTTYMLIGVLMGSVGSVVRENMIGSSWQGKLSVAIGVLMLLTGLSLWGVLPWLRWFESAEFARRIGGVMRKLLQTNNPAAPFALGLTNGLLPCGPVYAMALIAATTGDPVRGATVMFAFGLGTLPAMLGVPFLVTRLTVSLRSSLFRFAAVLVMIVGVQLVMRGLAVGGVVPHAAVGGVTLW